MQNNHFPVANVLYREDWILQRNNASVDKAITTTEILNGNDIDVVSWPAKHSIVNVIEKFWGQ